MGLVDQAEFHFFHFFPYTDLPPDHREHPSLWVDFPNTNYDPKTGHELYNRYLSEMLLADKLGYDGLVLNEHHNTQYSMNPAPNLTAAALIPQTKSWISVFGTPPNLGYPNRLAEEYAMLDVMSGGRLRIAFPLGTGMEYWANSVNPATARARFRESIDVILRCWTEDGPQSYVGDFYTYRYLNPWPKPMQQPYPECYIVGTGSPETIELAAELGFGYTVVFIPTKTQLKVFEHFRERLAHHGHEPTPNKVTVGVMAYVAETDAKAEEEFMPHVMYFFENNLRTTPRYLNPPGYVTVPEFRKRIQAADVHGTSNWEDLITINRIVAGTPEKVADAIGNWLEEARSNRVNLNLTLGDMPHWKVVKNTTLFAEEVIPKLRSRATQALGSRSSAGASSLASEMETLA
jgi:alkanesulfonate monooxygenase SsuD/methylene tetrahydromethanopterin reductase-like flavin-dependent oxidoreductase (luciferase family)